MSDVTIVMPYWHRPAALIETLDNIKGHYINTKALDVKVVVVDDGSHDYEPPNYPWLTFIKLPKKAEPKNPCTPFNIGFAEVKTKYVVITNPETNSIDPILVDLVSIAEKLSDKHYLLPSVYCTGERKWKQHKDYCNYGLHWYAMCQMSLIREIGGFDEAYREGAGWDDNDLVRKLEKAGTIFVNCDHLTAYHHREKQNNWTWDPVKTQHNRELYESKWGQVKPNHLVNSVVIK